MRISDWSSDVCSSDLFDQNRAPLLDRLGGSRRGRARYAGLRAGDGAGQPRDAANSGAGFARRAAGAGAGIGAANQLRQLQDRRQESAGARSEEHTSELQSLMRISYAVFCLKKKTKKHTL